MAALSLYFSLTLSLSLFFSPSHAAAVLDGTAASSSPKAACLLPAGRVRGAEDFVEGHCWPGWEEDVEDLLRDAAAAAAAGNFGA